MMVRARAGRVLAALAVPLMVPLVVLGAARPAWAVPPPSDAGLLGVPAGVSAALVEVETGQVIAAVDAEVRRPLASTVKLVTGLAVTSALPVGTRIVVGPEVLGVGGASAELRPGQVWDVDELLAALLLRSGNDAAVALSVGAAGDESAFLDLMATQLQGLGIAAELASPSGLDAGDRLSALELAEVARAVLAEPRLAAPAARSEVVLADGTVLSNRNTLLGVVDGATGLKTGYTAAAGWCLVGSAERDGRALVAVVLGAAGEAERVSLAATLLEHGFTATRRVDLSGTATLRTGRGAVRIAAEALPVTVPTGAVTGLDWSVVRDPDSGVSGIPVVVDGDRVASAEAVVEDRRDVGPGAAGLGRAAASAVYAALRASTADRVAQALG